jgi:hypothetical protein
MHAPPPTQAAYVTLPVVVSHVPICRPLLQKPQLRINGSLQA